MGTEVLIKALQIIGFFLILAAEGLIHFASTINSGQTKNQQQNKNKHQKTQNQTSWSYGLSS